MFVDDGLADIEEGDSDGRSGPAGLSDVSVDRIGSILWRIFRTSPICALTFSSFCFKFLILVCATVMMASICEERRA